VPDHVRAFAPGRANLIGEHTDYNQGLALPFAVTDGVTVAATALAGDRIEARALDLGEEDAFAVDAPAPAPGWSAFVRGAVAELGAAGFQLPGARIEISGSVPRGSGLSSSAALEVALCLALIELSGRQAPDHLELARLCARIEHRWAGARTGLLDPLASLCGEADRAVLIDFRSLEIEPLPLALGRHRLVLVDSGESHANAESGYNQRRLECEQAGQRLGLGSLREATLEQAASLAEPLSRRARHVITENERVLAAVRALHTGDVNALGKLIGASHRSLRDDYEVSTAGVEAAVAGLSGAGAIGARIMGGGFGGHVIGLLPPGAELPPGALEIAPGPGAHLLDSG
jgi:galactokinase